MNNMFVENGIEGSDSVERVLHSLGNHNNDDHHRRHWIHPAFSIEDEYIFFEFLSFLLYSDNHVT